MSLGLHREAVPSPCMEVRSAVSVPLTPPMDHAPWDWGFLCGEKDRPCVVPKVSLTSKYICLFELFNHPLICRTRAARAAAVPLVISDATDRQKEIFIKLPEQPVMC